MKTIFCSLALAFSLPLFGQKTDTATLSVTTEIGVLEEQKLVKDYVFLTQKDARFLFKVNLFQNGFGVERTYARSLVAFETKIGKSFSINIGGSVGGIADLSGDSLSNLSIVGIVSATVEPRFYYRQNQRIREGRSGNNLSDNYLALFGQKNFFFQTVGSSDSLLGAQPNLRLGVGWGIQRRIFKRGYFDIGLLATATRVGFAQPKWYFGVAPRAVLGLGFGPEKYDPSEAAQCAALRCFLEEKSQTRLNLIEIFGFSNVPGSEFLTSKLTAEHEIRIGRAARSVNFGLSFKGERGEDFFLETNNGTVSTAVRPFEQAIGDASVEFRNYYKMMRKIGLGESAKNFSGPFKVWRAEAEKVFRNEKRNENGQSNWIRADETSVHFGWGWGYQRRILEHGYFSFKAVGLLGFRKSEGDAGFSFKVHLPVAFGLAF